MTAIVRVISPLIGAKVTLYEELQFCPIRIYSNYYWLRSFKKPILSDFWCVRAPFAEAIRATTGFWKLRYIARRVR